MATNEIMFVIEEKIGVLNKFRNGWSKEFNLVSWNGNEARYDIREWDEAHERMTRGITLSKEEAEKLLEAMSANFK